MSEERNRTDRTDLTDIRKSAGSRSSLSSKSCEKQPMRILPPHGGYENLLSFQKSRIVFDATMKFCERFVSLRSRTHDQMVQAVRSGKQNILEGSRASGTSKETEIKLTNVARASLEELLEDYRDFLRGCGVPHMGERFQGGAIYP